VSKTLKITVLMVLVLAGIAAAGSTWWPTSRGEPARSCALRQCESATSGALQGTRRWVGSVCYYICGWPI